MPDNSFYYHAAYIVAAVVYSGYAVTLMVRKRRLMQRYDALVRETAPETH